MSQKKRNHASKGADTKLNIRLIGAFLLGLVIALSFSSEFRSMAGTFINSTLQRDNLDQGLVGHWTFDGDDTTTISDSWYNNSWQYRTKLTLQSSQVSSSLTNFPVYVDLSTLPADFWASAADGCADIRVTQSDKTTEVPREVVTCDTEGKTGELHFKAPSVSSSADTDFYIYYGNENASAYATNATYGAENVWTNGYEGVWHLGSIENDFNFLDSTGNNNSGEGVENIIATQASAAEDWSVWSHYGNTNYWDLSNQYDGTVGGETHKIFEGSNDNDATTYLYDYYPYSLNEGEEYSASIWVKASSEDTITITPYIRYAENENNTGTTVNLTTSWQRVELDSIKDGWNMGASGDLNAAGIGYRITGLDPSITFYAARPVFGPGVPSLTAGKISNSVDFDGTDDWVLFDSNIGMTSSEMTLSFWFNADTDTENQYFLDNRDTGSWWFIKDYTGGTTCSNDVNNICFENRVWAVDSDWNPGQWHYMTVTDDTNIARMYIDGSQVDSGTGEATDIASNLRIGTRFSDTDYYNGKMDEVRLSSVDRRSAAWISAEYTNQDTPNTFYATSTPESYSVPSDSSGGGNTGTVNGAQTAPGKIGQGMEFDGVDDYVGVSATEGDAFDLDSSLTITAWVKPQSFGSWNYIVSKNESGGAADQQYALGFQDGDQIYSVLGGDQFTATTTLPLNEWMHITMTWDGTTHRVFKNSTEIDSRSFSTSTLGFKPYFSIGRRSNSVDGTESRYLFDGTIDDVRIYDRVLTDREITQLYHQGGTTKIGTTLTPENLEVGQVGHWTFDGKDFDYSSVPKVLDRTSQGNDGYPYTEDDLVGYWSMDDEDVNSSTSTDRSGQGNDGVINGATTGVSGKIGEAYTFNGSSDYIDLNTNFGFGDPNTTTFTISTWFKTNTSGTNQQIMARYDGSNLLQFHVSSASDALRAAWGDTSFGALDDDNVVTDGAWHHGVLTYESGGEVRIYLDGNLATSSLLGIQNDYTSATELHIGNRGGDNAEHFNGSLDDVRVYDRVLSASEIEDIYNGKAGTGQKVTSGKIGQGLEFDGVDDCVETSSFQGPQSEFSASVWIKPDDVSGTEVFLGQYSGAESAYLQFINSGDDIKARIHQGTSNIWIGRQATAALTADSWQHYVFTWDGGTTNAAIKIYKDGQQVDDANDGNGSFTAPEADAVSLNIGAQIDCSNNFFNGTIDDVRIYDRALTPREVTQLYQLGR